MFLVLWLLFGAVVVFVWIGALVATCLIGVAQLCEYLSPGPSATSPGVRRLPAPPVLSAFDAQFLRECGIRSAAEESEGQNEAEPAGAAAFSRR